MFAVKLIEGGIQEVKEATWFQFADGILYLYGEDQPGKANGPLAAFPQGNVLSVRKTDYCCTHA